MDKVHVIYGSTMGTTETIANRIAEALGTTAINVASADASAFDAELVVLGSSTWGAGDLQDDWESTGRGLLESADLAGKKVAVFGLGDREGFGDSFCDSIGILAELAESRGAELVGKLPVSEYEGISSKLIKGGEAMGLALDETNESDKTDARLDAWLAKLK